MKEDHGFWSSYHFMANLCGKSGKCQISYFVLQNHCGQWLQPQIKRHSLHGRKAMTNQDSVLRSRDSTLWLRSIESKLWFFPVVIYGCGSWTIRKAEHQRIDTFKLWCWGTLLSIPWIARRANHSFLKEINPKYLLEGLLLKLKFQYFGQLMWRAYSLEKTLLLGKIEGRRRRMRGWHDWIASLAQWTWVWANSGRWWRSEKPGVLQLIRSQRVGHDLVTGQ